MDNPNAPPKKRKISKRNLSFKKRMKVWLKLNSLDTPDTSDEERVRLGDEVMKELERKYDIV